MIIAICDGTAETIYATAPTEDEAKATLWELVHQFLYKSNAVETAYYSATELDNYFGCVVIDTEKNPSGSLRGGNN